MKGSLKELLIVIASVLFLSLAIIAYFRAVGKEKANSHPDAVYTLVPPGAHTLVAINRPLVFNAMMNHPSFRRLISAEIPGIYQAVINAGQQASLIVFSFHPQGIVCYVQSGARTTGAITGDLLPGKFMPYPPQRQTAGGIDFYYYPDTGSRFFGYYVHNGIWAGSYSRRLLEQAAAQQQAGDILLPAGMDRLRTSFNVNEPVNLIFRAGELGLSDTGYLSADLYMSSGNIYCRGRIPYEAVASLPYASVGDTLSGLIENKYPYLQFAFQIEREDEYVSYTGWAPR
ncbi:MAG: hypothetical protein LBK65_07830 [Tannerellaceae bacterium]|jgi:hypothetical protein|nr:hypothetical protein [Tannerellaceae bacterium]